MSILSEWSKDFEVKDEPTPRTNPNPIPKYDKTIPEIAAIMGLEEKTVKSIYRNAVDKIKLRYPNLKDDWL